MKTEVKYQTINFYESLNELGESTRNIWFVFHGIGYLSRYFLQHFKDLPTRENYIIAPQAPAKYYLDQEYRKVGASWLTKEETGTEIENIMSYMDAVWEAESIPEDSNIFVLGFSQGVSIAARWVARRKIQCRKLIFYAGGLPNELSPGDFEFLTSDAEIFMVYGDKDPYLSAARLSKEESRFNELFKGAGQNLVFSGGHELVPSVLQDFIKN